MQSLKTSPGFLMRNWVHWELCVSDMWTFPQWLGLYIFLKQSNLLIKKLAKQRYWVLLLVNANLKNVQSKPNKMYLHKTKQGPTSELWSYNHPSFEVFTTMINSTPLVWCVLSVRLLKALCLSIPDVFKLWSVSYPVCETVSVRISRFMQQRYSHLWKTVSPGCDSLKLCWYQNDLACRSSHTCDRNYTHGENVSEMPQE